MIDETDPVIHLKEWNGKHGNTVIRVDLWKHTAKLTEDGRIVVTLDFGSFAGWTGEGEFVSARAYGPHPDQLLEVLIPGDSDLAKEIENRDLIKRTDFDAKFVQAVQTVKHFGGGSWEDEIAYARHLLAAIDVNPADFADEPEPPLPF